MNATKAARSLRRRIGRFSGDLSEGLCKAAQRFVSEMVHGIQPSQSVLLTTEPLPSTFKCLWRMVRACLKRWGIEEAIRYVKTCYDLERVRVLNYQGLQNLMPLV